MEVLPKIEQWIRSKSYEQLRAEERAVVDREIGVERYRHLRTIFQMIEVDREVTPLPNSIIKERLGQLYDHRFGSTRRPWSPLKDFFSYRIPIWQPLLALGTLALFLLWRQSSSMSALTGIGDIISPVVVYQTDTIYLSAPPADPAPPVVTSAPTETAKKKSVPMNARPRQSGIFPEASASSRAREVLPVASFETQDPNGRSAKDEAALMDLLVEVK